VKALLRRAEASVNLGDASAERSAEGVLKVQPNNKGVQACCARCPSQEAA
jgi:hypothetical protein